MTHTASITQVTLDVAAKKMTTEASTLGLKPGEWPATITVEHTGFPRSLVFHLHKRIDNHGDLGGFIYESASGNLTLTVLND